MSPGPEAADYLWFLGTLVRIRVSHAAGDDGMSVIENWAPAGDSPPLHVHDTEDELFQILEGELTFRVAEEDYRAGPGESILTRKGIPHTYRVESPTGARWLAITTRGDFESFVREMSRPALRQELPPPSGPPTARDLETLTTVALRHHIGLVGPPIT